MVLNKKTLFIFLTFFAVHIWAAQEQEVFSLGKLTAIANPEKNPPAIPAYLVLEESELLMSTDLRSSFFSSIEAVLIFKNSKSRKEVEDFYLKNFQGREWRLLQSENNENRTLLLAEGFSRKVLTIVIRDDGSNGSIVKIYFKKNSNY
ncbi:hypothetical protein [Leptospira sp. GIMC2001]|uniref:hypothetical protein n=1 Tax=Leptospira sp. GIMC2001 TaxID=1513297 RepID=UPI00234AA9EB|nr:hypothetical protein [Leptospira sp. GIMC2001]WCL50954.1 hypothetical protein O4O04_09125 [Leptospira sp. GIMC2001]